ncbi:hypothetical protein RF11_12201 [Thelohanellus kitauei]|uniref:Uncharacterized protein n=1 Tax=Thelohanellus kitauei TaxID=669202 RepID=A0A0C2IZJ3_THEKT|nr:hypothetical protein RF11_12201 [Thelohanellus kitauei]
MNARTHKIRINGTDAGKHSEYSWINLFYYSNFTLKTLGCPETKVFNFSNSVHKTSNDFPIFSPLPLLEFGEKVTLNRLIYLSVLIKSVGSTPEAIGDYYGPFKNVGSSNRYQAIRRSV